MITSQRTYLRNLRKEFPEASVTTDPRIVKMNVDETYPEELPFISCSHNVSELSINQIKADSQESTDEQMPELEDDFQTFPKLKILKLFSKKGKESYNLTFTFKRLHKILSKSPDLTTIEINFCGLGDDGIKELKKENLTSLEKLFISYNYKAKVSKPALIAILNKSTKLNTLHFQRYKNPLTVKDIGKINGKLEHIKTFNISMSTISTDALFLLLNKFPNITTLHVKTCKKLKLLNPDIPLGNMDSLTDIDFMGSNITEKMLFKILNKAKNIRKINIQACSKLSSDTSILTTSLDRLAELTASMAKISIQGLDSILASAKNIETLNLSRCTILPSDSDYELTAKSLDKLKILDLNNSNISLTHLSYLLKIAPNIKELKLVNYKVFRKTASRGFTAKYKRAKKLDET